MASRLVLWAEGIDLATYRAVGFAKAKAGQGSKFRLHLGSLARQCWTFFHRLTKKSG